MKIWGATDKGKMRSNNQDYFLTEHLFEGRLSLSVVCDGMGGASGGHVASRMAADIFIDTVRETEKPPVPSKNMKKLLKDALERANAQVYEKSITSAGLAGLGTTLVALAYAQGAAMIANVGDSRAYLIDEGGIRRITKDHSVVEEMVMSGAITEAQARTHAEKNLITRALGTEPDVEADYYEHTPQAGQYILLCTDGLSNLVTEQEMLFEVIHDGNVDSCCQRLIGIANDRGGYDNITVVLWAF